MFVSKECGFGAGDPSGEESGEVWGDVVYVLGVVVDLDVDLSIGSELVIWFLSILMAFDVEDVELDGHVRDDGSDGLNDVVVGA